MCSLRPRTSPILYVNDDDDNSSQITEVTTSNSSQSTSQEFEIDDDDGDSVQIVEGGIKFYRRRRWRPRTTNFSTLERDILIDIVLRHKKLNGGSPHKTGLQLPKTAWIRIAEEFYQHPEVTTRRPIEVLKSCWANRKHHELTARRYKIVVQPGRTRNAPPEVQIDTSYAMRQNFHPEDTEVYTGCDNRPRCTLQLNAFNDFIGDPLRPMRKIVFAEPADIDVYYPRKRVPLSPFKNRSRYLQKKYPEGKNEPTKPKENEETKTSENALEQKRLQLSIKAQKDLNYLKEQMFNVKAEYFHRKSKSNSSSQSSCC